MEICWKVEDGYAGPSRPQSFVLRDDDILHHDDVESALEMIEEEIRNDFREKITPEYNLDEIRAGVQKLFAEQKTKDEN